MVYFHLVPVWFAQFSVYMQLLFALVAFSVAFFAFHIYRLSCQRESLFLTGGFLLIGLSYFIKTFLNMFLISKIQNDVVGISLPQINALGIFAMYSHFVLFLSGLVLLVYLTLHVKSMRVLSLLFVMALLLLFTGSDTILYFHVLSTLFLFYICMYYYLEWYYKKNIRILRVFFVFVILLFSTAELVFSPNRYLNFMISYFLQLVAYVLMLIHLLFTVRRTAHA